MGIFINFGENEEDPRLVWHKGEPVDFPHDSAVKNLQTVLMNMTSIHANGEEGEFVWWLQGYYNLSLVFTNTKGVSVTWDKNHACVLLGLLVAHENKKTP